MTNLGLLGNQRPLPPPLLQAFSKFGVKAKAHAGSIAKFCEDGKQHFASLPAETCEAMSASRQPPKTINQILAEALTFFMGAHWTNGTSGAVRQSEAGGVDVLLRAGQNPSAVIHIRKVDQGAAGTLYLGRVLSTIPESYTAVLMRGCQA